MKKTKIDWCDASWNPITGCRHNCPYCYAYNIAKRFGAHLINPWKKENHVIDQPMRTSETHEYMRLMGVKQGPIVPYPYDFEPTFHRYRLDIPAKWTKPLTIFVCSMADLFGEWVPDQWIKEVIEACRKAPQHRYLFLTKNPARYDDLEDKGIITKADGNFWLGSTTTDVTKALLHYATGMNTFQSCEPMLAPWPTAGKVNEESRKKDWLPKWVIFGAETGNRKGKVIPKKEWVDNAVQMCRNMGAAVFMKESLRQIMGPDFIQEYPWHQEEQNQEAP